MRAVDFYFDFLSPYAYLASEAVEELCARNGAQVVFRPVLFAGLLNRWGQRGPAEIPPKAWHTMRECLRYARLHDLPLRSPKYHPFRPLTSLRACLQLDTAERAAAVHALFRMGWGTGGDLGSDHEIAAALSVAGLDGPGLVSGAGDPEVKRSLKEATDTAIARGVFGIPTMLVGDELFWGLDQLRYVELYLQGRDPIAGEDLRELAPLGAAAWRTGIDRVS